MFKFVYSPTLDLPVCTDSKCGYAIEFSNVRRHLRKTHNISSAAELKEVERFVTDARKEIDHNQHQDIRSKYMRTTVPDYVMGPVLPALDIIPIRKCLKCPRCAYISRMEGTMRKHLSGAECSKFKLTDADTLHITVNAQSIFGGNRQKYFQVVCGVQSTPPCEITRIMLKMESCKPSGIAKVDISRMNSFASIMRFDKHLQNNDLTYDKAFQLASISNTERDKYARKLMASYHKRAFDTTERKVFIKSHSFLDSDLSLSLSNSTVDLYDARTSRLLSFLFASCVDEASLFTHLPGRSVDILTHLSNFTNSSENESLALLHELLLSLFFEAISDEEDGLILFISCSSVFSSRDKTSYRLGTANEVSPMIAALKHLAKCVAVTELYVKGPSDTTEGWERIIKATQGNMDTGVFFVQYCMKVCHRVRNGEMQKVRFILCPRHHHCAIVDGIEISLPKLGEKMKALQRKAWSLLRGGILNGLVITADFWQACAQMQDTFTDRTPSYWFASHRANFHVYRHWSHALKEMLRPVILDAQGNFNLKKTKDFVNKCEELQRVIYVLLQICSGAPARASELGAVQICNSSTACRNLYLSNGQLFSAIFYHKGRNMQEGVGKPIVRYPDAVTSGIIMAYLIIVRPVEAALALALQCDGARPTTADISLTNHRDFLFVSRGEAINADRLRIWFELETKAVGIPLQTSQYRQFHAGVIKNFIGGHAGAEADKKRQRDSASFIMHNQSGHTEETGHNNYGVSEFDMHRLTGTEIEAFRQASQTWHNSIGLKHGTPCPLGDGTSEWSPGSQHGISRRESSKASDSDGLVNIGGLKSISMPSPEVGSRLEKIEEAIFSIRSEQAKFMSLCQTFQQDVIDSIRSLTAIKRNADLSDLDIPVSRSEKKPRSGDIKAKRDWKAEMRRFLGKHDAHFQSKEQEIAVDMAVEAEKDTLVVLPTGGGKSMTFMMSAFVKPSMVAVVIVPLVALQEDILRRCSQVGIQASLWRDRETAGARVIIASVEHVSKKDYQVYIRNLFLAGRLHAIFIDEGHLVVLWREFRVTMDTLRDHIRPSGVRVPIFTLTATSPPLLTEHIALACGMKTWSVIRQQTSRPNIKYEVRDVTQQELYRSVDATLSSQLREYNTSDCRAIVYVPTRESCGILTSILPALMPGTPCFMYHAGMSLAERTNMQGDWAHTADGKAHIMVATSAFGCGIDIPTVRIVIHAGLPGSLIEYIQESGRAGRDGDPATSTVFNVHGDHWKRMPADRLPFKPDRVQSHRPISESLFGDVTLLQENSKTCRRWILDQFADGAVPSKSCSERGMQPCDVCHLKLYKPVEKGNVADLQQLNSLTESANTKSSTTSASADEVREFFARLGKNGCPACTVETRKLVKHAGSNNEKLWSCYKSRCLRCGLQGHNLANCTRFRQGAAGAGGCYSCTFRDIDGVPIHDEGEYGRKTCRMKKALSLCLLSYEKANLRRMMCQDLPGFSMLRSHDDVEAWLIGKEPHKEKGITTFLPWFQDKVLLN